MQLDEKNFWENVHQKMNQLYSHEMCLTNQSNIRDMISFLEVGWFYWGRNLGRFFYYHLGKE